MKPNKKKAILALKFSSSMLNPKIRNFKDFISQFSLIFYANVFSYFVSRNNNH